MTIQEKKRGILFVKAASELHTYAKRRNVGLITEKAYLNEAVNISKVFLIQVNQIK